MGDRNKSMMLMRQIYVYLPLTNNLKESQLVDLCEFGASMVYRARSRTARAKRNHQGVGVGIHLKQDQNKTKTQQNQKHLV